MTYAVSGWLAFFCFALLYLAPIVFLARTFLELRGDSDVPGVGTWLWTRAIVSGALALYGVAAARRLRALDPRAVPFTKQFIVVNAGATIALGLLPSLLIPTLDEASRRAMSAAATADGQRVLTFSVIWFLYFTYSAQVRELFPR